MLAHQKVGKHKRRNLPHAGKLKVLITDQVNKYSSMLSEIIQQEMSALAKSKETLSNSKLGQFPLQCHQETSENCMDNQNHQQVLPECAYANDTSDLSQQNEPHIQNTIKKENITSAAHELANLHQSQKYQAFKKRILNNPEDVIQINSDSEDKSDTGKSFRRSSPKNNAERLNRNKEAAKKSRIKKKMLQNEQALRTAFLAQENCELRQELDALKYQMTLLQGELRNRL